jgi:hypothetical protein
MKSFSRHGLSPESQNHSYKLKQLSSTNVCYRDLQHLFLGIVYIVKRPKMFMLDVASAAAPEVYFSTLIFVGIELKY